MRTVLNHAKVILSDGIINGGIEIENGLISRIFESDNTNINDEGIDCCGCYLSPGFIDIHLHGGGGRDFMDATEQSVDTILRTHARHGTTAFLPTTLSAKREDVVAALKMISQVQHTRNDGPKILGAHIEGNFFSMQQKGAQDPRYIYAPTKENYEPLIFAVQNIKRVSCAPELENALNFADEMVKKGVVMSAAHSNATYDEFVRAVEHGFMHVTHIYNGNSWLHNPYYYCQIGLCEAALLLDEVSVEVIADGKHLPKELLRLIYKIKGADINVFNEDIQIKYTLIDGKVYNNNF